MLGGELVRNKAAESNSLGGEARLTAVSGLLGKERSRLVAKVLNGSGSWVSGSADFASS